MMPGSAPQNLQESFAACLDCRDLGPGDLHHTAAHLGLAFLPGFPF